MPLSDSNSGFLKDGHPEEGDLVFSKDGKMLGSLTHFYDKVVEKEASKISTGDVYRVKVSGVKEDPICVCIVDVQEIGITIGKRLVAFPGVAASIPANNPNMKAQVVINNNTNG